MFSWIVEGRLEESKQQLWNSRVPKRGEMMRRQVSISFACLLIFGLSSVSFAANRVSTSAYSSNQSSPNSDAAAEREFLALANRARADAGVPPLQADEGLTQAARAHSAAMAERRQLSHQLPGEPGLSERIAATSHLLLDQSGENVAYAGSVTQAQNGLMHSPPHRENLLNPAYNLVGIGVAWSGTLLYVTQDFGHGLRTYSVAQAEDLAAKSLGEVRRVAHLPNLTRADNTDAREVSCAMSRADSVNTPAPRDSGIFVLRYTTMQPEVIPSSAQQVIDNPRTQSFAVGVCYARTNTYPSGVYWFTLILY